MVTPKYVFAVQLGTLAPQTNTYICRYKQNLNLPVSRVPLRIKNNPPTKSKQQPAIPQLCSASFSTPSIFQVHNTILSEFQLWPEGKSRTGACRWGMTNAVDGEEVTVVADAVEVALLLAMSAWILCEGFYRRSLLLLHEKMRARVTKIDSTKKTNSPVLRLITLLLWRIARACLRSCPTVHNRYTMRARHKHNLRTSPPRSRKRRIEIFEDLPFEHATLISRARNQPSIRNGKQLQRMRLKLCVNWSLKKMPWDF